MSTNHHNSGVVLSSEAVPTPHPVDALAYVHNFDGQRSSAVNLSAEEGIATAEFSIVTLAAVGFAGLLVTILASGEVREMLLGMVRSALGG
ncbi:hypothetical protein HD598_002013 [Neomicrococcus aestuarii]|uniref:DUF4244 domain-containing protein n=1 Tax=Neomicrococcus aestuarii TaxID=556325 RepID=A0A7W8TUX1_9MICC|nr:DUF4244 domain-containing protein [Neomicrococcus aestuarii]MBB5513326.1 hypothetical protein [Neomicrococcus aestuarii]